jgi:hypothetical protein
MATETDVVDLRARRAGVPTRIEYSASSALPKLAWVARLDTELARLTVLHGRAVECRPKWLVEGVWDGPFEAGEFHLGAHLFGSGIRLDANAVYFMPSAALVDRLVYCWNGACLLVSNSVVALLAATGAHLDPDHDYLIDAKAMLAGVDRYDPSFHVVHASIEDFRQLYHTALIVREGGVTLERTIGVRRFASFHEYVATLRERLAAVCANALDPARRTALATYGTLSSGYDSTAVSVLVKDLGVRRFFTYVGSWAQGSKDQPEYETASIAAALGIEAIRIETPSVPSAEDELLLRAASPLGQQLPLIAMAQQIERAADGAVVFTGFHGDVIWDVHVPDEAVSAGIIRHDVSGLDLSELRLKSGFANVAVPFFFAASIESVVEISRSASMRPWTLGTAYDRPISRRIVEDAGVPRERFGWVKGGLFGATSRPANRELRKRYLQHVHRKLLPLPLLYARGGCDRIVMRVLSRARRMAKRRLGARRLADAITRRYQWFYEGYSCFGRRNYRSTLYVWSVMEAVRGLRDRGIGGFEAAADPRSSRPTVTQTALS